MKHKVRRIHFVGIGGSGMSGIAEVLVNLGYQVSGSDLAENAATRRLRGAGREGRRSGTQPENVDGADAVVVSTRGAGRQPRGASRAREQRIPVVPRALMLAELMRLKQGVAIAGTHGKTTTTSLVASVLAEGGLDPTFVIGGRLNAAGSNARLGAGDFIVVEADESDASFLHLQPVIAVVTNIDADHMDTYQHDFARLKQAFVQFLQNLPFYGAAVLCVDDAHVRAILPRGDEAGAHLRHRRGRDACAPRRSRHDGGRMRFRALREGAAGARRHAQPAGPPQRAERARRDRGRHASSASRTQAIAEGAGRIPRRRPALPALRRDPARGGGSFTLVDDYGHHPAEMAATLEAARGAFPGRRIVLAFQPHRYTRTRDLFEDFVRVLSTADVLLLAEVYAGGRGADRRRRRPLARARAARRRQGRAAVRRGHRRDARGDPPRGAGRRRGASPWARARSAASPAQLGMNMAEPIRFQELRGELRRDEPMARHVSWRAGGRGATASTRRRTSHDLCAFLRPAARRRSRCCSSAWARTCWCATAAGAARWCSCTRPRSARRAATTA